MTKHCINLIRLLKAPTSWVSSSRDFLADDSNTRQISRGDLFFSQKSRDASRLVPLVGVEQVLSSHLCANLWISEFWRKKKTSTLCISHSSTRSRKVLKRIFKQTKKKFSEDEVESRYLLCFCCRRECVCRAFLQESLSRWRRCPWKIWTCWFHFFAAVHVPVPVYPVVRQHVHYKQVPVVHYETVPGLMR